jgi:hypothetical protein
MVEEVCASGIVAGGLSLMQLLHVEDVEVIVCLALTAKEGCGRWWQQ